MEQVYGVQSESQQSEFYKQAKRTVFISQFEIENDVKVFKEFDQGFLGGYTELIGQIGGVLLVAYAILSLIISPIQKFNFRVSAARELFLAKTSSNNLFLNDKTKIEP